VSHKPESVTPYILPMAAGAIFTILLSFTTPLSASETLTLLMEGVKTVYEGDQAEYYLEVENTGAAPVAGVKVLDALPAMVEFVDAIPTSGGTYDPVSGVWTLPDLGTGEDTRSAGLKILVLVQNGLINDPLEFVTAENRAEIIAPLFPETIKAAFSTNIVCAFCIDWEIVSVKLDSDSRVEFPDPLESRFFLYVEVRNNGPVYSDATLSARYFNISGGGFDTVALIPSTPVPVSLDAGETRTITFSTDWEDGPDSNYTISWEFEVSDLSREDPVTPNTVAGSWSGKVTGGGGGGCSINDSATADPLWLLYLVLAGIYPARSKTRRLLSGCTGERFCRSRLISPDWWTKPSPGSIPRHPQTGHPPAPVNDCGGRKRC